MFDRFDICDAYAVLEWDYNVNGWLRERPSNQRRMEATSCQLARIGFSPSLGLSYSTLTDNGKEIYWSCVVRWGLPIVEMTDIIRCLHYTGALPEGRHLECKL